MDWKITKRVEGCARCERAFEGGERHFSLLLFDEEHLGREDRCVPCFENDEGLSTELVFWRTRRRIQTKRGLAVDFESIERLFLALDGRDERRLTELRYLLSLLLMRKRRLKLVRVQRTEGAELMICRRPRREEVHKVVVFALTAERAGELRQELERIFEGAGAEDLEIPAELAETSPPEEEGEGESASEAEAAG